MHSAMVDLELQALIVRQMPFYLSIFSWELPLVEVSGITFWKELNAVLLVTTNDTHTPCVSLNRWPRYTELTIDPSYNGSARTDVSHSCLRYMNWLYRRVKYSELYGCPSYGYTRDLCFTCVPSWLRYVGIPGAVKYTAAPGSVGHTHIPGTMDYTEVPGTMGYAETTATVKYATVCLKLWFQIQEVHQTTQI